MSFDGEMLKKKINSVFLLDAGIKHDLCGLVDEFTALRQDVNLMRGQLKRIENEKTIND